MKIGQLAKRADCAVETIRYWEKEGLVPAPYRSEGNYRIYNQSHLDRVLFIRNCRSLDMSLDEVRRLLTLRDQPQESCDDINALVDEHIDHVVKRIQALQTLELELKDLRQRCNNDSDIEHCEILKGLAKNDPTNNKRPDPKNSDSHVTGLHGH